MSADLAKIFTGTESASLFFFLIAPPELAYVGVIAAPVLSAVLIIARQRTAAGTVLVATAPWTLLVLLAVPYANDPTVTAPVVLSGCCAIALIVTIIVRRRDDAARASDMNVTLSP